MSMNCNYEADQAGHIRLDCPQSLSPAGDPGDWGTMLLHFGEWLIVAVILIVIILTFARIATQWERAVILRLGKFRRVAGPGLFFKIPLAETITEWVSLRVEVTQIKAEKTLTKDTVPIDVQTVMFWRVVDARAAVVEVDDYENSLELAAQTALREAIGAHDFTELLTQRASVDAALRTAIEQKATAWGLEVQSIEIQDVQIPADLQDAMSREAQAEREKHARIILGESEIAIAQKFVDAAKIYETESVALQLRQMNIIYETTKERGSTILLPTTLLDALMKPR
jgi:regulator of protease activity HflC (stomatin/prohibitin superfamily)